MIGTIEDRLHELIKKLTGMREETLGFYCTELEKFTPNDGNNAAAVRAGILHDLDRHITNIEWEIQRIVAKQKVEAGVL